MERHDLKCFKRNPRRAFTSFCKLALALLLFCLSFIIVPSAQAIDMDSGSHLLTYTSSSYYSLDYSWRGDFLLSSYSTVSAYVGANMMTAVHLYFTETVPAGSVVDIPIRFYAGSTDGTTHGPLSNPSYFFCTDACTIYDQYFSNLFPANQSRTTSSQGGSELEMNVIGFLRVYVPNSTSHLEIQANISNTGVTFGRASYWIPSDEQKQVISSIENQTQQITSSQQQTTDAVKNQTEQQQQQYEQDKQEEADRENQGKDDASEAGGIFNFNLINPFTPLFLLFNSGDSCVSIPTLASWLHTEQTSVCPFFPSSVRTIVTPVLGISSMMLLFGFAMRWLGGNQIIHLGGD